MGRALVREPQVFLLDEPLSNLDAKLRGQMRAEILELQRRVGVTSLYVTHDQAEAMTLGDRIAVLNGGRLLQLGTPQEVFRHPRDLFVAAFMGTPSMNLLRGEVAGGLLRAGSLELRAGGVPDGPVVLGFRPEALLPARAAAGLPRLEMTVDLVEELGNETLVYGEVPGEVAVVAIDRALPAPLPGSRARVAARLQGFTDVHPGETLPLGLRTDARARVRRREWRGAAGRVRGPGAGELNAAARRRARASLAQSPQALGVGLDDAADAVADEARRRSAATAPAPRRRAAPRGCASRRYERRAHVGPCPVVAHAVAVAEGRQVALRGAVVGGVGAPVAGVVGHGALEGLAQA